MKNILYKISQLINIALTAYVGLWLMFIKPIFDCCTAIDMGTLNGGLVAITVIKCLSAGVVGTAIYMIGAMIIMVIFKEY